MTDNQSVTPAMYMIQRMLVRNLAGLTIHYLICCELASECEDQQGKRDWLQEADLAKAIAQFCYGMNEFENELMKHM